MADCQMSLLRKNPVYAFHFFFFISVSCSLALLCSAASTITQGQSVRDGETLVSDGQEFEMGFFSPDNSTSRFVGIWYRNIPEKTYTWVANRERPVSDKAGVLTIGSDGNLVVLDGNNISMWSSNASISENSAAVLNDKGNLILSSVDSNGDINNAYWQSFDHPTDTYLPGMRVVVNRANGENYAFTSWKSDNNPSMGNYSMGIDPRGSPQIVIWERSRRRWRSGHWNSQIFTGVPNMSSNLLYGFRLSDEDDDGNRHFTYVPSDATDKMMFRIRWDGFEEHLRWEEDNKRWGTMQSQPDSTNECELYNKCGNFAICSSWESPICSCMKGFEPRHWDQWRERNWSGGCSRKTQFQCQTNSSEADGFVSAKSVKLPDFADLLPPVRDTDTCKDSCLSNCSCTAYAYVSGIGCLVWNGELLDVQYFTKGGNTLFIRLAHSDLGGDKSISTVLIVVITIIGVALLGVVLCLAWRFKSKLKVLPTTTSVAWLRNNEVPPLDARKSAEISTEFSGSADLGIEGSQVNGSELPLFNFNFVAFATNNFSEENKLGQGGFGPVYKGMLPSGQEIAVKRLSRKSGQGAEEFKNEIILIAKLQHRNLVRLLGCCLEGEEKILLYEYMPNKSLDFFLFDPEKQGLLDWRKRYTIIEGIARGLLYLHRDSRLRIIHRDLKASNILLDEDMNPKISDFGMARIFGGNQNEANTNRVVGTYGYMAPEYAMEGLFSVKSDVYSFGVLLLEIVSGRRNTSYRLTEYASLLRFAWHLWSEGKAMELVDPSMAETCTRNEVLRCIQVGMLCVQDPPGHRPTMSSVVLMLESEAVNLPLPRQPTFSSMRDSVDTDFYSEGHDYASLNDLTVTMVVDGR